MATNSTLLTFRILLLILTTIVLACDIAIVIQYHVQFLEQYWSIWLSLILAVVSNAVYSFSFRRATFFDPFVRAVMVFILTIGWFVPSSYHINLILKEVGSAAFFKAWNCGLLQCTLTMTTDICGLAIGVFGLVELYLADKFDRRHIQKPLAASTIFVAPIAQQNTQYIPLEQHQQLPQHQVQPQYSPYQPQPYQPQSHSPGGYY
ncbi:hypothetical protein BGZ83_002695 [Gryganskiella cystojenkinii]|nr:hypothetical protein BGZ83_002695 [Gryganskiella cystojenkinii]